MIFLIVHEHLRHILDGIGQPFLILLSIVSSLLAYWTSMNKKHAWHASLQKKARY